MIDDDAVRERMRAELLEEIMRNPANILFGIPLPELRKVVAVYQSLGTFSQGQVLALAIENAELKYELSGIKQCIASIGGRVE